MSGFNLRKRARVCYYEPEEPPFDEFIYCTECRDYVYEYCSIHGPLLVIPDDKVPAVTGLPPFVPRAALTIPRVFLHIAYSRIPDAGLGVFSTLTLPSGVRFGPYRGQRVKSSSSCYGWQIYDRNNKASHVVDARDAATSNWMRYVNCARHHLEQNLVAFQYQGELYYRTIKIVPRFTELLVFYGSEFANWLGVDLRQYSRPCPCDYCQARLITEKQPAKTNNRKTLNEEKKQTEVQENVTSDQAQVVTKKKPAKINERNAKNEEEKQMEFEQNVTSDQAQVVTKKELAKIKERNVKNEEEKQMEIEENVISDRAPLVTEKETAKTKKRKKRNGKKYVPPNKYNVTKSSQVVKVLEPSVTSPIATPINVALEEISSIKAAAKICSNKSNLDANKFTCDQCSKSFNVKTDLENCIQSHLTISQSVKKDFSCKKCSCTFATRLLVLEHAKSVHGVKYFTCSQCEYATSNKGHLEIHLRTHTGEKPLKCSQCSAAFVQSGHLKAHVRTHTGEKPFKCSHCSAAFVESSNLKAHVRTHTGEKPFKCSHCSAAFVESSNLKAHVRTHTGEKPFKCSQCSAAFAHSNTLKDHERTHTGEKPFKCSQCRAAFAKSSHLKVHERTHTGEKPFKCSQCSAAFAQSGNLKKHERTHTGEKPFKCSQCSAAFAQSSHLKYHQRTHTGERPFKCSQCSAAFAQSATLKKHERTHTV